MLHSVCRWGMPLAMMTALLLAGCNSSSSSSQKESSINNPNALSVIRTQPAVDAQTPEALRATQSSGRALRYLARTTGRSFNDLADCNNTFDPGTEAYEQAACGSMVQVRSRFFSPGPTELTTTLAGIDDQAARFVDPELYWGCVDPDSDDFTEAEWELNRTFDNGDSIVDFGFPASVPVNCMEVQSEAGEENGLAWQGFAFDADTGITWLTYRSDNMNSLTRIDDNGTIDGWVFGGTLDPGWDGTSDDVSVDGEGNISTIYTQSTGLIHVRAEADSSRIEMTITGNGMGDGCGTHLITDGSYLYYFGNTNNPEAGTCYAEDVNGQEFDSEQESVAFCIQVGGDEFDFESDASECEARGLAPFSPGDDAGADSITLDDLRSFPTLNRENFKAYNSVNIATDFPLLTGTDTALSAYLPDTVNPPVPDENNLSTYASERFYLRVDSRVNNVASGFCRDQNDTGTGQQNEPKTVDTVYQLVAGDLTSDERSTFNGAPIRVLSTTLDSGFRESQAGGSWSYWADYDITMTIALNGNTVETQTFTAPADGSNTAINYEFQPGFQLSSSDTVTLSIDGTNRYRCGDGSPNLRAAASGVTLGRPALIAYTEAD